MSCLGKKLTIYLKEDKKYYCHLTDKDGNTNITDAPIYFSIKKDDSYPDYIIHKSTGTAAKASKSIGTGDAQLDFKAVGIGVDGNDISIEYKDPEANDSPLSVEYNTVVVGNVREENIVVNLATDGTGTITSIANEIKAAVEADAETNALVNITVPGTGLDVVSAVSKTFLEGGISGGIEITTPLEGRFTITIPKIETNAVEPGKYIYDIIIVLNSLRSLLAKETVDFLRGVTE